MVEGKGVRGTARYFSIGRLNGRQVTGGEEVRSLTYSGLVKYGLCFLSALSNTPRYAGLCRACGCAHVSGGVWL